MMEILYRDEHLIAVHKPHGLLVHRSAIDRHERRFALQMLRDQIGRWVYPLHRLDKPVSGVLLFALDQDSARQMLPLFSSAAIDKHYLAIVRGYTAETGVIDYPLQERRDKMTDALVDPDKPAQAAITAYRRLATVELPLAVGRYPSARYSLLTLAPKTGRKHQIRRHMKHIFHPLIGDTTYGDGRHNHVFRTAFECRRLLLAATRLAFTHPWNGRQIVIEAPPDAEFMRLLEDLGWADRIGTV